MAIRFYTILFTVILPLTAWADKETYIREYTYIASDADSKISSRKIAKQEVKRELLSELGTHIFSKFEMSETADGNVTAKEEVVALTAGFVAVETLDEKWNGSEYYIKAKLEADPDEIHEQLKNFKKKDDKTQKLKSELLASHEESELLRARLKKLQAQMGSAESEEDQTRIQEEYDSEVEQLNMVGLTSRALRNQIKSGFGWVRGTLSDANVFGRSFLQSLGNSSD